MSARHAVLGLAGHVDHGKTSLVEALTGHAGDRLPEEKRRGITIDLGFCRWSMPERGVDLSVIDVPGHERFVGAMAAGASGIDLVLLAVAADDGVMPQTREHLVALEALGVAHGVVAVTKADLAESDEQLALVDLDLDEALAGTFLARAPRVRVSSRAGTGLDALRDAVAGVVRALPAREVGQTPWLSIDRAFVRAGHGTVVTGTLVRGVIAVGDTLEALPVDEGGRPVVVRGLAVHGEATLRAEASTRLALQIRGAEPRELPRGVALTRAGAQRPTRSLDARLSLVPDAPSFSSRTALVMHLGAAQVTVRARLLEPLTPGVAVRARLTSESLLAAYAGQRFVLRRPELEAHRTIGGGEVLDPHPALPRPKRATETTAPASLEARLVEMVGERARGATLRELEERVPLDTALAPMLDALVRRGALAVVSEGSAARWLAPRHEARAREAVLAALARFHAEHPALSGATPAELAGAVPAALRPLVPRVIDALLRERALLGGERVSLKDHDARAAADRVAEAYRAEGLAPRADDAVREATGLPERAFRDAIRELLTSGRLHRIATGLYVHHAPLAALTAEVQAHLDAHGTLSPGDFKALTGLSRKHAIAMLEHLDRLGVTKRRGDDRVRA